MWRFVLLGVSSVAVAGFGGCRNGNKSVIYIHDAHTICASAKEELKLKDDKIRYDRASTISFLAEKGWRIIACNNGCYLRAPKKYGKPCAKVLRMIKAADVRGDPL